LLDSIIWPLLTRFGHAGFTAIQRRQHSVEMMTQRQLAAADYPYAPAAMGYAS
jgi:hypothetical protein